MNGKGRERKRLRPNSSQYLEICQEGLKIIRKSFSMAVSRPRFEPGTTQIRRKSATHLFNMLQNIFGVQLSRGTRGPTSFPV
jgi:hypothetical protein